METRKVQLTGSSTFTISLPKEWATEQGIDPGQQLTIRRCGRGALVVGAEQVAPDRRVSVDLDGATPEEVQRTVRAFYTLGYDEFELGVGDAGDVGDVDRDGADPEPGHVDYDGAGDGSDAESVDPGVRRAVRETTGRLAGLEIAVEEPGRVVCRDLLAAEELSLDRLLSKLQFAALSMHQDATTAAATGDDALAELVADRRRETRAELATVERRVRRTLADFEASDRLARFDSVAVADRLDRVAAEAERITDLTDGDRSSEATWAEATRPVARRVRTFLEDATDAVLSPLAPADAHELRRRYEPCREAVDALAGADDAPPTELIVALGRTADAGRDVADRAVRTSLWAADGTV